MLSEHFGRYVGQSSGSFVKALGARHQKPEDFWLPPPTNGINAAAESLSSMIQEIKTIARGFRRFANLKIAILFFALNP